jgi:peptidoglycan/LPS O-acetylase OafA/YrhL
MLRDGLWSFNMGHLYRPDSPRYGFIDGLRGLAVLAVMLNHAFTAPHYAAVMVGWLRLSIHDIALPGRRGVQLFFVISGFVIAHSLRGLSASKDAALNFGVRRALRLTPAYWICMLVANSRILSNWHAHPHEASHPGFFDLMVNALYLPGIMGRPRFLGVTWTLCLEMQLYLVFGAILWLTGGIRGGKRIAPLIVFTLGVMSVAARLKLNEDMESWWFTETWNLFALGVLARWASAGRCGRLWFYALLVIVGCSGIWFVQEGMMVGCLSAVVLYVAGIRGGLDRWLIWRPLQYFGTISYSLYLVHNEILAQMDHLVIGFAGQRLIVDVAVTLGACGISILAAHVLHVAVEEPTRRLAAAMKGEQIWQPWLRPLTGLDRPLGATPLRGTAY